MGIDAKAPLPYFLNTEVGINKTSSVEFIIKMKIKSNLSILSSLAPHQPMGENIISYGD